MARLTVSQIERAFTRRGWRYEVMDNGDLRSRFDGVTMLFDVDDDGQAARVWVGIYPPSPAAVAQARNISAFLEALSQHLSTDHAFYRDGDEGAVIYVIRVPAPGGMLDDDDLTQAIAHGIFAAQGIGQIIDDLAHRRVTLDQTLQAVNQAADRIRRSRGPRIA